MTAHKGRKVPELLQIFVFRDGSFVGSDCFKKVELKDISKFGARLASALLLNKGDTVEFVVDDDFHEEHYRAVGEVRWINKAADHYLDGDVVDDMYEYGLEIMKKEPL